MKLQERLIDPVIHTNRHFIRECRRIDTNKSAFESDSPSPPYLLVPSCIQIELIVKMPFTAVLLAGGQSRRMGRDKAFLPVEWEGKSVPLWDRQLSVLKALAPAELLISGPRKQGYPESVPAYADEWHGAGPLGGIATCLGRMNNGFLLVLAIDLPRVQPSFMEGLVALTEAGCGVVPSVNDRYEPLLAVYPKAALELAVAQLRKRAYVLQQFVKLLVELRLVIGYEVETGDQPQLDNWNEPRDLSNPRHKGPAGF